MVLSVLVCAPFFMVAILFWFQAGSRYGSALHLRRNWTLTLIRIPESQPRSDDSRLAGFGSGFAFGKFPEFGFGSVSALRVRIRIGSAGPGSDSDRFRRARFGFGSDPPTQVRIRIGYRFGSDSASEPGACRSLKRHWIYQDDPRRSSH
jgi:hypothetical protein